MRKPATLSVQVLGPFAVARDGVTVPAHELASRKGRMLLKLLVARRGARARARPSPPTRSTRRRTGR